MQKALPKIEVAALPGSLHVQRVKCGKANCRCAPGLLHLAYYRFWREDGRLRKLYVRRSDLERVRAGLALWRECRAAHRSIVGGAAGARVMTEQRENLRRAGVEPPRRMYPAKRPESSAGDNALSLALKLSTLRLDLSFFRFGSD